MSARTQLLVTAVKSVGYWGARTVSLYRRVLRSFMGNRALEGKNNWTGFPAVQQARRSLVKFNTTRFGGRYRMDGGVADTACYKQAVNRQGELEALPAREYM